jgi:hypothetical protein
MTWSGDSNNRLWSLPTSLRIGRCFMRDRAFADAVGPLDVTRLVMAEHHPRALRVESFMRG